MFMSSNVVDCIFCNIPSRKRLRETDRFFVVKDRHPVTTILGEDQSVDGFNIGANCGVSAGQTIFHCHVHRIPRRSGDVKNPRGGVRLKYVHPKLTIRSTKIPSWMNLRYNLRFRYMNFCSTEAISEKWKAEK